MGVTRKEPSSDNFYASVLNCFINGDKVQQLKLCENFEFEQNVNCAQLSTLATNPNPHFRLRDVRSKKIVVSFCMAAELVWNETIFEFERRSITDPTIKKLREFRDKFDRRIRSSQLHSQLIIDVHRKLNEIFDGIKKDFVKVEMALIFVHGHVDCAGLSEIKRKRFENAAKLMKDINRVCIDDLRPVVSRLFGRFPDINFSTPSYLMAWNYLKLNTSLSLSSGKAAFLRFFDDPREIDERCQSSTMRRIRQRLYLKRYALLTLDEQDISPTSKMFSNIDPQTIIVDRRTHKIVVSGIMGEELAWMSGVWKNDDGLKSINARELFEKLQWEYVGFTLSDVTRGLANAERFSSMIKEEHADRMRKEYFLSKADKMKHLAKLYAKRRELFDEMWNDQTSRFDINEDVLCDKLFHSSKKWPCQRRPIADKHNYVVWSHCVARRDFPRLKRCVLEYPYDNLQVDSCLDLTLLNLWRAGLFTLMNVEGQTTEVYFDKMYKWFDFMMKEATRRHAWTSFADVFCANVAAGRLIEAERMTSVWSHKKFTTSFGKNATRKTMEMYVSLIFYQSACDEQRRAAADGAISTVSPAANLTRVAKTSAVLTRYAKDSNFPRLAQVCASILESSAISGDVDGEDETFLQELRRLEYLLCDYLRQNPLDALAFEVLLRFYNENPLIEALIKQNIAHPLAVNLRAQIIRRDAISSDKIVSMISVIMEHLDYDSNRNNAKCWRLLSKLLEKASANEMGQEKLKELCSGRVEAWEKLLSSKDAHIDARIYKLQKYTLKMMQLFT